MSLWSPGGTGLTMRETRMRCALYGMTPRYQALNASLVPCPTVIHRKRRARHLSRDIRSHKHQNGPETASVSRTESKADFRLAVHTQRIATPYSHFATVLIRLLLSMTDQ